MEIDDILTGLACSITKAEYSWDLRFGDEVSLTIFCRWRLVANGGIRFGDGDHEQQFGLPAPVDGVTISEKILAGSPIVNAVVTDDTSDLVLIFANGARLDVFNSSGGYEGWTLTSRNPMGFEAVAMGGGRLVIFDIGATRSRCGSSTREVAPA
jgi:hypothetical protein